MCSGIPTGHNGDGARDGPGRRDHGGLGGRDADETSTRGAAGALQSSLRGAHAHDLERDRRHRDHGDEPGDADGDRGRAAP